MRHLVVFAKAPRMGQVKTRLAADIGPVKATAFYRQNLQTVFRNLGCDRRWRCWLAITPDKAVGQNGIWGRKIWPLRIPQGGGDLGARMTRVMKVLPPGEVIIIGSDIPAIKPNTIACAFGLLASNDAVFGPSTDGGYWLVGLKRRPAVPMIFSNVRWSGRHALADTMANLEAGKKSATVENMDDIDDGAAYRRCSSRRGIISTKLQGR